MDGDSGSTLLPLSVLDVSMSIDDHKEIKRRVYERQASRLHVVAFNATAAPVIDPSFVAVLAQRFCWGDIAYSERADGDPIRRGIAQDMRHGIRLVCGIEFQPGALGVLLQQALSFKAATDTLADKLNQILQLVFNRRFEALKSG